MNDAEKAANEKAWIEKVSGRLRATRLVSHANGSDAGMEWASEEADLSELKRLRKVVQSGFVFDDGEADRFAEAISPDSDDFWGDNFENANDGDFLEGFADAALEVLEAFEQHEATNPPPSVLS